MSGSDVDPADRPDEPGRRLSFPSLIVAIAFPTLLTLVYFVGLANQPAGIQQSVSLLGKSLQFGVPIVWLVIVPGTFRRVTAPRWPDLIIGLGLGLAMALAIMVAAIGIAEPTGRLNDASKEIAAKISGLGISNPITFGGVTLFYACCHSLLEEFYFRWLIYGELRRRLSFWPAGLLASLAFMAHHVVVLSTFLGWDSALTALGSAAVALAGFLWSAVYEKTNSLYAPWLSHAIVDAVLFTIGYRLAFGAH